MYAVLDLDFSTGEEAGEKSEGSEPVPRKVRSVEEALEEVEIFQEDLGDIAAFVNGRGSLVFATFSAETIRVLKSLGKEEPDSQGEKDKIVIECHEGNHVGAKMMFQMILNDGYFWPTLFKECLKVTKSCILCLKFNIKGYGFHPARTITAGAPFDHALWDIIGKLPTSINGYNFILVIIDVLTRFVILRPLVTKSAVEIASRLVEVFANFGVPKILQSDNDRALLNETTEKIRGLAGFQFRRIMAYFPRTNGVVERFIQEAKLLIFKVIRGDTSEWELFVPAAQMALNDRVLSRHDSRAFSLMFGRRFNGFKNYREVEFDESNGREWIENAQKWGIDVWEAISLKSKEVGDGICNRLNKKKGAKNKRQELKVGDFVMKMRHVRTTKFAERWEGPFQVIEKGQDGYRIQEVEGRILLGFFPIEHLKLIEELFVDEEKTLFEVEEILDHQGEAEDRLYLVKWKDYAEKTWEKRENFQTTDCILEYWDKVRENEKKKKGRRKKRD